MKGAKYIPLFLELQESTGVPAEFLWALAGRESRWNPRKVRGVKGEATGAEIRGRAVGLLQLTRKVVQGYNKEHGTTYRKADMLDARRNATVGAWYLTTWLPRFEPNWRDPRDVALIAQAWNSGPGGTRRVLDSLPMPKPTVDDVRRKAQEIVALGVPFKGLAASKYRFLAERKTKWVKSVAADTAKAFADPNFAKPPAPAQAPGAFCSWLQRRFF